MIVRTYEEILKSLKDYTIANQGLITDFNKGSVLLTQYEATSRIVERFYIDVRNGFVMNLKTMAYSIFDFQPKSGVKANVQVKFKRAKARDNSVTIQAGVKISSNGLMFETTEVAIIKENEVESNLVAAQAMDIGLKYNVEPNTVNVIESIINSEVVSVTNPKQAFGGADNESETETLDRFKKFINGLQGTNKYGIESAVLGVDGVKSCFVAEHFPPVRDNVNVTVYVDDGSGTLSPSLKTEILDIINGNDTETNPGKRACGINIEVENATAVNININVSVKVIRTEPALAKADIQKALENVINNLNVGEDVILTSLIIKLRRISYISDINTLTMNGAKDNIDISDNQVAKLGTVDITVENQ